MNGMEKNKYIYIYISRSFFPPPSDCSLPFFPSPSYHVPGINISRNSDPGSQSITQTIAVVGSSPSSPLRLSTYSFDHEKTPFGCPFLRRLASNCHAIIFYYNTFYYEYCTINRRSNINSWLRLIFFVANKLKTSKLRPTRGSNSSINSCKIFSINIIINSSIRAYHYYCYYFTTLLGRAPRRPVWPPRDRSGWTTITGDHS